MQLFRSIDSESCLGFPSINSEAYDRGLVSREYFSAAPARASTDTERGTPSPDGFSCIAIYVILKSMCPAHGGGRVLLTYPCACGAVQLGCIMDRSIQNAYIHAIRKASAPTALCTAA